jgi:HEAT repeat protein
MIRPRPSLWIATGLIAVAVMTGRVGARQAQDALGAAIDSLGAFDFPVRTAAARTVRRAPAADVVPLLAAAVKNHKDSYVRYKALVLLTGFEEKGTVDVIASVMADRNDRLRAVAYEWFEHNPASAPAAVLIDALQTESSEFVRPALTRALTALNVDPRVRSALAPLITSGEDFFRGEVIEGLGDYKAAWAAPAILAVAKLDGPLQDDAVLALGKIGDPAVLPSLAALQKEVPRERQPALAAAMCMLGVNCDGNRKYLDDSLRFSRSNDGFQVLLRASAHAMGAFAERGDQAAFKSLIDAGVGAGDQARGTIALALGAAAVRQPAALMTALAARSTDRDAAIELLRDAFDMLEEDFAKETFYVTVRRAYWTAADGSGERRLAEAVLQKLEF